MSKELDNLIQEVQRLLRNSQFITNPKANALKQALKDYKGRARTEVISVDMTEFSLEALYILIKHLVNKDVAKRFAKLNKVKL